jgi:hypothetical protein
VTERLRELFEDLLVDEPEPNFTIDEVVQDGYEEQHKWQRRRPMLVGVAAAVVFLLAGIVARSWNGDEDLVTRSGGWSTTSSPTTAERPASSTTAAPSTTTPSTTATSATTTSATSATTASDPPAGGGGGGGGGGGEELLPDPGFEASPPGWDDFGPSTVLAVSSAARNGRHALAVTTRAGGPERVVTGTTNDPVEVTTTSGVRYTGTCWVRSAQAIEVRVQLQEYTADWVRSGDPTPSNPVALSDPGRWYQVGVTHTGSGDGHLLPLTVFTDDVFSGDAPLLVDDCSLTAG